MGVDAHAHVIQGSRVSERHGTDEIDGIDALLGASASDLFRHID